MIIRVTIGDKFSGQKLQYGAFLVLVTIFNLEKWRDSRNMIQISVLMLFSPLPHDATIWFTKDI